MSDIPSSRYLVRELSTCFPISDTELPLSVRLAQIFRMSLVAISLMLAFCSAAAQESPWCSVPSHNPNAVRFTRLSDDNAINEINGGGAGLQILGIWGPNPSTTFLFDAPTAWPLKDGDDLVLEVANTNWDLSGNRLQVDATLASNNLPSNLIWGGPNSTVLVRSPTSCAGYWGCGSKSMYTFTIKKVGGSNGTSIVSGDRVSIATESGFFLHIQPSPVLPADGLVNIDAAGTAPGQDDTTFQVWFGQVQPGLGWRPETFQCSGPETGTVTGESWEDASTYVRIPGATVKVDNTDFAATTINDGSFKLHDSNNNDRVPPGRQMLVTTKDTYQPGHDFVNVPTQSDVAIQLQCTTVSGKVVDGAGKAISNATIDLVDPNTSNSVSQSSVPVKTDTNGLFTIRCVQNGLDHDGFWNFWISWDGTTYTERLMVNGQLAKVPPEGLAKA